MKRAGMGEMQHEDGQALVEMAVTLPVFLLVLFGIAWFAILLFGWCNITYASRVAVRYASIHSNTSLAPATTASITANVTPYLIASTTGTATTTVVYNTSNTIGSQVTVTVSATYKPIVPYASLTAFALSSTSQRTITR